MSKTYQYIVDVIARTKAFTQGMQGAIQQVKTAERAVENMNSATSRVGESLKGLGAAAGIGFGIKEAFDFGKELINLSGEVQGVERAFKQIGNEDYLQSLRNSTHGTVSDLQLMKLAVQANNFKIPLQSLGNLFEFAAARAQSTGKSVNELVGYMIEGLGKGSTEVLDNLGISAKEFKSKLGGVGIESVGVGKMTEVMEAMAKESLAKMGGYAENTATQVAQIATQWANFREQLSKSDSVISSISGGTKVLSSALTQFDGMMSRIKSISSDSKWYDGFIGPIKGAQYLIGMFGGSVDAVKEKNKQAIKSEKELQDKIDESRKRDGQGNEELIARIKAAGEKIKGMHGEISKSAEEMKKAPGEAKTAYEQLTEKITTLTGKQQELALANKDISGITAQIAALQKQKEAIDEVIRAAGVAAQYGNRGENGKDYAPVAMGVEAPGMALAGTKTKKLEPIIDPASVETTKSSYQNALDEIAKSEEAFMEKHQAIQGALEGGFMQIGQSIVNALGFAKEGLGGFVSIIFETATKLIAMALSQSIANSIVGATASGAATGPGAVFATPAFIATAIGGVMAAFAAIPKFAQGGIAYGPTLGMFGEYPGASSNPEVVAPLSRLRDMIQPGGGTTVIMPAGVEIDGYKLRVLLKRVDKSINSRI